MKNLVLNIGLSLLTLLGAVSCNIKEDMSNCPGSIILDYSAYSSSILDDIGAQEQVDVFIFDPDGICIDIYTFTYGDLEAVGFEFEVPITYSNYNAVVWQGLDSENYTSNRMVLGQSYEDFHVRLVYDTEDNSYESTPDPLWASPFEPIEFCAKITRHRVYMTRLHTELNVSVVENYSDGSSQVLGPDDFDVVIHATNNVYTTDYTIDEVESIELEYTDDDDAVGVISLSDTDYVCSCTGTLRITPDMDCTLQIEDVNGNYITFGGAEELDLVDYMLATKSDDSLTDQEFLDLNKVWDISLVVEKNTAGYATVSLVINGWVVWFSGSELS